MFGRCGTHVQQETFANLRACATEACEFARVVTRFCRECASVVTGRRRDTARLCSLRDAVRHLGRNDGDGHVPVLLLVLLLVVPTGQRVNLSRISDGNDVAGELALAQQAVDQIHLVLNCRHDLFARHAHLLACAVQV